MEDCHTHPDRFEIRTIFSLPTNVLALPGLVNTAKERRQEYYFVGVCPIRNVNAQHLNPQQDPCSWGYTVGQLVEVLRYKPNGRGFDFRCGRLHF